MPLLIAPADLPGGARAAEPRLADHAHLDAVVSMRPAAATVLAGAVVAPEGVDHAAAATAGDTGCAVARLKLAERHAEADAQRDGVVHAADACKPRAWGRSEPQPRPLAAA